MRSVLKLYFCIVCLLSIDWVLAFPDGAPVDTCVKKRPNQPHHPQARTQPLNTLPYLVVANSDTYRPGQEISVDIKANQGEVFRGFFIQARDADSNEWIGTWDQTENTKGIPECSAISHADRKDKIAATLVWKAPHHKRGRVYFTGTVLKEYGTFWSEIVAKVSPDQHSYLVY